MGELAHIYGDLIYMIFFVFPSFGVTRIIGHDLGHLKRMFFRSFL